jgi:hypothetical protein
MKKVLPSCWAQLAATARRTSAFTKPIAWQQKSARAWDTHGYQNAPAHGTEDHTVSSAARGLGVLELWLCAAFHSPT